MDDNYEDYDYCDGCQANYSIAALNYKRTGEKFCNACEVEEERLWALRLSEAEHVA